jgi:hypothetical protein
MPSPEHLHENEEVIMRSAFLALLLATNAPAASLAADDPAEVACHQKASTLDISDCLQGLTAQWDKVSGATSTSGA